MSAQPSALALRHGRLTVFPVVEKIELIAAPATRPCEPQTKLPGTKQDDTMRSSSRPWLLSTTLTCATLALLTGSCVSPVERDLFSDELIEADYWDTELRILSAGMGFDNIIGVPGNEFDTVRKAMGTWYAEPNCVESDGPMFSTTSQRQVELLSRGTTEYGDGLPIVFTWPVLASTVHPEDFLFTLSDGSEHVPDAVTMFPNWERNERNTIVIFSDLGNRGVDDEPDRLIPVRLEIVDDGTPLLFVGPGGVVESGVGLSWETDTSPYEVGPSLVGAKLNHLGERAMGEGGVRVVEDDIIPNDAFALYGGGDFKIRILTSGGFSPDGLLPVTPDRFEDFFRLHATGPGGEVMLLTEVGVDYEVAGGRLRILGLSDLGQAEGGGVRYDDCYVEDRDNYIDIVLEGDEDTARSLTHVEIPAEGDYQPFYNPGGPGPEPFEGVRYTAPGPADLEPIINALDDPMRVSHP